MHAFLNSELAIKGQMQVNFLTLAEERDQTATSCISNHGRGPSIKDVGIYFRVFGTLHDYLGRFFKTIRYDIFGCGVSSSEIA